MNEWEEYYEERLNAHTRNRTQENDNNKKLYKLHIKTGKSAGKHKITNHGKTKTNWVSINDRNYLNEI